LKNPDSITENHRTRQLFQVLALLCKVGRT
jgi:hypothetical protein